MTGTTQTHMRHRPRSFTHSAQKLQQHDDGDLEDLVRNLPAPCRAQTRSMTRASTLHLHGVAGVANLATDASSCAAVLPLVASVRRGVKRSFASIAKSKVSMQSLAGPEACPDDTAEAGAQDAVDAIALYTLHQFMSSDGEPALC